MTNETITELYTFEEAVAALDTEAEYLTSEQYWNEYLRLCELYNQTPDRC